MKGSKTLYVSDLDGTLLRHDQTVSPFTAETINTLTARGMLFSYATARSLVTAKTVTKGLNTHFPLIIYNGAFVRDNVTEEILLANYFDASVYAVLDELFKANIYPIVYANVDGKEHFSFIYEKCTPGLKGFADTRVNDPRTREVYTTEELTAAIFSISPASATRKNSRHFTKNTAKPTTSSTPKTSTPTSSGSRSCRKPPPKRTPSSS